MHITLTLVDIKIFCLHLMAIYEHTIEAKSAVVKLRTLNKRLETESFVLKPRFAV
jgi:hypothetical protein